MGSSNRFWKDPNAILDYSIPWATWLGTDTIVTSTWIVPTGITKVTDTKTTTTTTIWLSGGTVGAEYALVNRITTVGSARRIKRSMLSLRNANATRTYAAHDGRAAAPGLLLPLSWKVECADLYVRS